MNRSRIRLPRFLAAIALGVLLVAALGVGGGSARPGATDPSTLVMSRGSDPQGLDPAQIILYGGGLETLAIAYERLVDATAAGKIVPALATSWKISNRGRVYTFNLRRGVTFADGSPFNADEVRFTWQRIVALKSPAQVTWAGVKDVRVVSPYVVQIVLERPSGPFLATLAAFRGAFIGPSRACVKAQEKKAGDYAPTYFMDHTCGTGPYQLTSWQRGQQLLFDANQRYRRGWKGSHVQHVVVKVVKDPATGRLLLEQGQLNLAADQLPLDVVRRLQNNPKLKVLAATGAEVDQIYINMTKKPTNDVRVRRAIALAFDYNAALKQAYRGFSKRTYSMLAGSVWPSLPKNAPRYNTNVAAAKRLLKEAGYENGLTLTLITSELNQFKDLALVAQSSLAKAGIKVNIELFTTGVLFQKIFQPAGKKPFDLAIFKIGPSMPDPDDIVKWYHTKFVTVINPGWGNKTTDSWITQAQQATNHAKRVALYQRVLRQMNTDVIGVWGAWTSYVMVMEKNVTGLRYVPYYTSFVNPYDISKT